MKRFYKYLIFLFLVSIVCVQFTHAREITVDVFGRGDFKSVQEAINSVRAFDPAGWVTIRINEGIYKEKLEIPAYNTRIRLVGEDAEKTILVWYDHANINKMGTFRTYTLKIGGSDIVLENLTIMNAAEPLGQAVAVHVEGDRVIFNQCRLIGNQDTYYGGRANCRQFFYNCYIEGTTDYIFGPSTAWFEKCTIHSKRNSYITAASTPENQTYGFIFNNCKLTVAEGVDKMYLGRPWRGYAMTLFRNCELPEGIHPEGWENWRNPENEKTARYSEYKNTGPGAGRSQRVKWSNELTRREARQFTIEKVLKGSDGWNGFTEFLKK